MASSKTSSSYVCQSCGYQSAKWLGKCPSCDKWDTFAEERVDSSATTKSRRRWVGDESDVDLVAITSVTSEVAGRLSTGVSELDRALGGGVVAGSLTLIGGDPGVGKSTLALQVAGAIAKTGPALYVSGEESPNQIRMRAERLDAISDTLFVLPETQVEKIAEKITAVAPSIVIVDSIQTIWTSELPSAPGTVGQIREAAGRLLTLCKQTHIPIMLIGHVTKDGAIAGPRLLEHMVDTVLYFEGEKESPYRILRVVKNRFGSTNEIGVFEMRAEGLVEIDNPSEIFLSEKTGDISGSVVTACVNGTRPLLVEIQALVCSTHYPSPRRATVGVDSNRVSILMAIIEKRAGYHLMGEDVFVNVAGGVRIDEPATDLGIVAAVVSSFRDLPIDSRTIVMGEVGLGGEIRSAPQLDTRLNEAVRLGFTKAVIPKTKTPIAAPDGITIEPVSTIAEAIDILIA